MKRARCLPWILGLLVASACAPGVTSDPSERPALRAPAHVRVRLGASGPVRQVRFEEYVQGAVLSEFSPGTAPPEVASRMLQLQAIVARTYAIAHLGRHAREGFDLCATTHCQLYAPPRGAASRWSAAASTAARHTASAVLWFGTSPASAVYHADCGGHTSAARDVWGGTAAYPYLVAIADEGAARTAHASWTFTARAGDLLAALNKDARTRVGRQLSAIAVVQRDAGGRAALVVLRGEREPLVRGEELRDVLNRAFGARAIRSTRFSLAREENSFVFSGAGYGHGVGLCQAGALARLRAGAGPEQVLAQYYPGTRLVRLR